MAGLVDSEAHFESRAVEYGVPAAFLQALKREGFQPLAIWHLQFSDQAQISMRGNSTHGRKESITTSL